MAVVLVGGGARSGKSRQALKLAKARGGRLGFIATAEARDAEMRERIAAHRAQRGAEFVTIEEPIDVASVLKQRAAEFDAVIVDCLTLWLGNLMHAGRDVDMETGRLLKAAKNSPALIVLVANEVGAGIVPENELARRFRDLAGLMNQQVAEAAGEVYWMAFGCPLKVK